MSDRYYLESALYNNSIMSQTLRTGTVKNRGLSNKPASLLSGSVLQDQVKKNIQEAVQHLSAQKENDFTQPHEAKQFVSEIARIVNQGIVKKPGARRTYEIPPGRVYGYPVDQIELEFDRFCAWYGNQLTRDLSEEQAYTLCALCENAVETVHFFNDGCGRTGRMLALFFPLRHEYKAKQILDRRQHLDAMGPNQASETLYSASYNQPFIQYFQQLPFFGEQK